MRERCQALGFIVAWASALAVLMAAISVAVPKPVPSATASSVRMEIRGLSWTISYASSTTNNTAFAFLREANLTVGFELAWVDYAWPYHDVFITSINGTRNDEGRNLWWQYCVDGMYASAGAASQALGSGDVVTWTYAAPGGNELCR